MNKTKLIQNMFPPSTVNNSRTIVRGYIKRYNDKPSEEMGILLEEIMQEQFVSDYSNADVGEPPYKYN